MIASEDDKPPWANALDTVVEIEVNGEKHKVPPDVKERYISPLSMILSKSGKPQTIFRCYGIAATLTRPFYFVSLHNRHAYRCNA